VTLKTNCITYWACLSDQIKGLRVMYSDPSKILKATIHLKSINSKCFSIDKAAKSEINESCFK